MDNCTHKNRVQTNLEKPGKPGKIDFSEKSQGNSGNFFMENFSFKTL